MTLLTPKNVKFTPSKMQILTTNVDFRGHIPTSQAENTAKKEYFKSTKNSLAHREQRQNNFEKSQNCIF